MKSGTAYWPISPGRFGQSHPQWRDRLAHLWHKLLSRLDGSDEPRVWLTRTPTSTPAWNAYDPITGQSAYLMSEAELRGWLENLHYGDRRWVGDRECQLQ